MGGWLEQAGTGKTIRCNIISTKPSSSRKSIIYKRGKGGVYGDWLCGSPERTPTLSMP